MSDQKLTDEELDFVIEVMGEYPAGVDPSAWGYGPMAKEDKYCDDPIFPDPEAFSDEVIEEYG